MPTQPVIVDDLDYSPLLNLPGLTEVRVMATRGMQPTHDDSAGYSCVGTKSRHLDTPMVLADHLSACPHVPFSHVR